MPTLRDRTQQQKPVQAKVEIPADFPDIPQSILDRFPDAADWQRRIEDFWNRTNNAIQEAQRQIASQVNSYTVFSPDTFKVSDFRQTALPIFVNDGTGVRLGHVLVVDVAARTLHVGIGTYANDDTPIYMDIDGKFSLGATFSFDPAGGGGISVVITGGSIDNTPIGVTTPAEGHFTFGSFIANRPANIVLQVTNTNAGATSIGGIGFGNDTVPLTAYIGSQSTAGGSAFNVWNILNTAMQFGVNNTLVMSLTSAGLLALGTGGTGATNATLNLNGGSAAGGGPLIGFYRNGAAKGILGTQGAIFGGSSDDIYLASSTAGNVSIWTNGVTVGQFSPTGLLVTGDLSTSAPTVGAAGKWKLGQHSAGVVAQAGKVRVNIDGTDYDLLTA